MSYQGLAAAQGACGAAFMLASGPQPASYNLSWAGTFWPGDLLLFDRVAPEVRVDHGLGITVTLAELMSLVRSDPGWYVIL